MDNYWLPQANIILRAYGYRERKPYVLLGVLWSLSLHRCLSQGLKMQNQS